MSDRLTIPLLALLAACTAEPTTVDDDDTGIDLVGDDDETTGDDDTAGDDDTPLPEPTASYPEEEQWFALVPGTSWTFDELLSGGPEPTEDHLEVRVERAVAASALEGGWPEDMVAYEIAVDRTFGGDERHWYGINGTGVLHWLRTERSDLFDVVSTVGDGDTVLRMDEAMSLLLNDRVDGVFLVPDVNQNLEAYVFDIVEVGPEGATVEALEYVVEEDDVPRGTINWRPESGLWAIEVELSGLATRWTRID